MTCFTSDISVAADFLFRDSGCGDEKDDFQRALYSDAKALDAALVRYHERQSGRTRLGERAFESLRDNGASFMQMLRTPLFPKKTHDAFASGLYDGLSMMKPVEVHVVLASPTALVELDSFLAVLAVLQSIAPRIALRMHLVRWKNLVDVARSDLVRRSKDFLNLHQRVASRIAASGFSDWVVMPIDVAVTHPPAGNLIGCVIGPMDVVETIERIEAALAAPELAEPELSRNLAWATAFYARQRSLQSLGPEQPLFDLALRTSVGKRVIASRTAVTSGGVFLLLTSELNRRFLPCYGSGLPIANIALRHRA